MLSSQIEINSALQSSFVFCPHEHREVILMFMMKHFNLHESIPGFDYQFHSNSDIRGHAVLEIYNFCKENDLRWTWSYLWTEW